MYNIYLPFYVMFLSLPLLILHFFQFEKRKYYQICIISKKNIVILNNYWVNFTTKRVDFFSFKRRKKLKGVLMFNATPLQEKKFINFLTKKHIKNASSFFPLINERKKMFKICQPKYKKKHKKNCG